VERGKAIASMARKKRESESDLAAFVRQYGRKRQKRQEPNDRGYDRKLETKMKRMRPEEADRLLHGTGDDDDKSV
jgi:hypothetical protein